MQITHRPLLRFAVPANIQLTWPLFDPTPTATSVLFHFFPPFLLFAAFFSACFNALDAFVASGSALIPSANLFRVETMMPKAAALRSPGCNAPDLKSFSMSVCMVYVTLPPFSSDRDMAISPPLKAKDTTIGGQKSTLPGSQKAFFILDLPWT